jgi:hypothetical protein
LFQLSVRHSPQIVEVGAEIGGFNDVELVAITLKACLGVTTGFAPRSLEVEGAEVHTGDLANL